MKVFIPSALMTFSVDSLYLPNIHTMKNQPRGQTFKLTRLYSCLPDINQMPVLSVLRLERLLYHDGGVYLVFDAPILISGLSVFCL